MLCWFPAVPFPLLLVGRRRGYKRNLPKGSSALMLTDLDNFKIDETHELKELSTTVKKIKRYCFFKYFLFKNILKTYF